MSSDLEKAGAYHGLTKQAWLAPLLQAGRAAIPAVTRWASGQAARGTAAVKSLGTEAGQQAAGRWAKAAPGKAWGLAKEHGGTAANVGMNMMYLSSMFGGSGGGQPAAGAPGPGYGSGGQGTPGGNMSQASAPTSFNFDNMRGSSAPASAPLPEMPHVGKL